MSLLLALDQGTSSSRSIVFDESGSIVAMAQREFTQMFPKQTVPIGEVVLKVENLTLKGVFSDVSFEVRAGEILASRAWSARAGPTLLKHCSA